MSPKLGRPTFLTEAEEQAIAERAALMRDWGFPLTLLDLRNFIKAYLDLAGRQSIFQDNLPGKDFAYGFLKRNPHLNLRHVLT